MASIRFVLMLLLLIGAKAAEAEDGYDLWLRYRPVEVGARTQYESHVRSVVPGKETPTVTVAREELQRGLRGMLGREVPVRNFVEPGDVDGRCQTTTAPR